MSSLGAGILGNQGAELFKGILDMFGVGIGKSKEGQLGGQIGGTVGGIAGGIFFGPIGAAIGAAIGNLLGSVIGDLFAPGRIAKEKKKIDDFFDEVFDGEHFKTISEKKAAAGFEEFKGPVAGAAVALGAQYALDAKKGNQGTIIRFAGQGLGNFKRLGLDAEEAKEHILELADAMDFDLKSGVSAIKSNISSGVLSIKEFKEEVKEARKNLKQYGDTSKLTANELSALATAHGNTGSRLVTVNEILAGTIDIAAEFDEFISGTTIANNYLASSFEKTAKETGLFNEQIGNVATQIREGKLSLEEATIELNKFRKEAGLAALDLGDFKISAVEIQKQIDAIKKAIQTVRDAIKGGITAGVTSVEFNKADIEKGIKKTVYRAMVDAVAEGMVDGIIKASLVAGPISAAFAQIGDLTSKFVAGDLSEADFFTGLETVFTTVQPAIDKLATAVGLTSERFREILETAGILPDILDEANNNAKDLAKELRQAAKDLLLDPTLSPLKPKQRVAEAQATFEDLRKRALAGDEEAARQLPAAARQFLEEARKVFASSAQYEQIFDFVRGTLLDVADKFGPLEDTETKQLRTLEEVRAYLKSIDINLAKLSGGDTLKPTDGKEKPEDKLGRINTDLGTGRRSTNTDNLSGDRLYYALNQNRRTNNDVDSFSGDRLYYALNPNGRRTESNTDSTSGDRLYDALRNTSLFQDSSELLKQISDELSVAGIDDESRNAESRLIASAQLLTLKTSNEYLASVDRTLKKISGNIEEQLNQNVDVGRKTDTITSNRNLLEGRSSNLVTTNTQLTNTTGTNQVEDNRDIIGVLLGIESALIRPSNNSPTALTNSLLTEIRGFTSATVTRTMNTESNTWMTAGNTWMTAGNTWMTAGNTWNIYLAIKELSAKLTSTSSASFAEGGIVSEREISATLHGPEVVIPLEKDKMRKFLGKSNILNDMIAIMGNKNNVNPIRRTSIQVDTLSPPKANAYDPYVTYNNFYQNYNTGRLFNKPTVDGPDFSVTNNLTKSIFSQTLLQKGGIVTSQEMPALLHGPEAVIPLPYGIGGGVHFSSPELIEEVRGLRSEMRNSNRNDSDQRPIVVQGDFNVGQVKLGEFVQKTVQVALNNQQIRVPQKAIQR